MASKASKKSSRGRLAKRSSSTGYRKQKRRILLRGVACVPAQEGSGPDGTPAPVPAQEGSGPDGTPTPVPAQEGSGPDGTPTPVPAQEGSAASKAGQPIEGTLLADAGAEQLHSDQARDHAADELAEAVAAPDAVEEEEEEDEPFPRRWRRRNGRPRGFRSRWGDEEDEDEDLSNVPLSDAANKWALKITAAWQSLVNAPFEVGRMLNESKDDPAVKHGQWLKMFKENGGTIPVAIRKAQKFMAIAKHPILSKASNLTLLPSAWNTLYALTELPDELLEEMISDGTLNPDIELSEVEEIEERAREEGSYRYADFRDWFDQGWKLMHRRCQPGDKYVNDEKAKKWSEPDYKLIKHLADSVYLHDHGEHYSEDGWDWKRLPELSEWLVVLHKKCEEYDARESAQAMKQDKQEKVAKKKRDRALDRKERQLVQLDKINRY
jgi:hypothetical protein